MAEFNFSKGYDIPLKGETAKEIADAAKSSTVAIKPSQFRGIKPKLLVAEGDKVKSGSPLFYNKVNEEHKFTSPVAGKVISRSIAADTGPTFTLLAASATHR